MPLAIKPAAAVNCHIFCMNARSKGMAFFRLLQVHVMRQQGSLFAPLVNGEDNTGDKRREEQKYNDFHTQNMVVSAAYFKIGALSC